jgi:hypothetical protein
MAPVSMTSNRSKQNLHAIDASHSNKKLPTWKGGGLLEGSRLSLVEETSFKEKSLDRINSKKLLPGVGNAGGSVAQSRHELIQNNYKKVIQNHPTTINTGNHLKYDDTDFLNKMFTKEQERNGHNLDSSEVLHKSES